MGWKIQVVLAAGTLALSMVTGAGGAAAWVVYAAGTAGILAVSIWEHARQEQEAQMLCQYLMRVQDDLQMPEISACREGKMSILASEIYKLVVLLKERSTAEAGQKAYLAAVLSDISHQIKTPLTSITIMMDLLKDPDMPKAQRLSFIEKIDSQIGRMLWLVRSLLTLSQLEADVLKLKRETVDVREILQNACAPFEVMAEVKEVHLALRLEDETPMPFACDIRWTVEALSNIIKNCVEHTPAGGTVELAAQQNNFAVTIQIRDTGEGIAKEDLPHIFERFYKGSNSSPDSVGIGLALARQIIVQQSGAIHVESQAGVGTRFVVRLYSEIQI